VLEAGLGGGGVTLSSLSLILGVAGSCKSEFLESFQA